MRAMKPQGYRLLAARDDAGTIQALAGFSEYNGLYYGHHLHVWELVTTASERSHGYGKALMDQVEAIARDLGCDADCAGLGTPTRRRPPLLMRRR